MARNVQWRRQATDAVSWHQDEALNATIYILRDMGPTGFLLKEDGEQKKFKVYLGDPHSCTCQTFLRERDLCKHICWVLLRKFRVPRQNQVTWQLGLVEREINEILRGVAAKQEVKPSPAARHYAGAIPQGDNEGEDDQSGGLKQRPIAEDDVCPICQEEFLAKHLPVTFCKFGCGNSVHIKCMKVWADHQKSQGETTIKCPLCREDFGPITLLNEEMRNSSLRQTKAERLNQHLGATCNSCRMSPVTGKCYKCVVCAEYYLCQNCFVTPVHGDHSFQFREKPNQRWRAAQRGTGTVLPQAVISAMMTRELGDQDYDTLLQLDSQAASAPSDLSEDTVRSFRTERVRTTSRLLAPGQQCRVCLQRYSSGQVIRRLPCRHEFHQNCIDNWLLHQHATCPVDGTVYTNQTVRAWRQAEAAARRQQQQQRNQGQPGQREGHHGGVTNGDLSLEIPGVGIASLPRQGTSSSGSLRSGHLTGGQRVAASVPDVSAIAISGNSFAVGQTSEDVSGRGDSAAGRLPPGGETRPVDTRPLVPAPPSIPRLQDVNVSLGVGRHRSSGSPGNSRPPSGRQQDTDNTTRNGARTQTRRPPPPSQPRRNPSGSRTRDVDPLQNQSHNGPDLCVGYTNAPTLTSEPTSIYTRERPGGSRRNSVGSPGHPTTDQLYNGGEPRSAPDQGTNPTQQHRTQGHSDRQTGTAPVQDVSDLFVGVRQGLPLDGVPRGSPGRLRHGQPSSEANRSHLFNANRPSVSSNSDRPTSNGSSGSGLSSAALYIGADPSSTESCLRQFLMNSIAHKNQLKSAAKQKANVERRLKAENGPHWGEVREMCGDSNDITLAGSAVGSTASPTQNGPTGQTLQ